jgi:hypothetical protein
VYLDMQKSLLFLTGGNKSMKVGLLFIYSPVSFEKSSYLLWQLIYALTQSKHRYLRLPSHLMYTVHRQCVYSLTLYVICNMPLPIRTRSFASSGCRTSCEPLSRSARAGARGPTDWVWTSRPCPEDPGSPEYSARSVSECMSV